jgi:hypothetical protein
MIIEQKEIDQFFDSLSEKEIRRRQDLCNQQLELAHKSDNKKGIENLQIMERDLTSAMLRRC